MSLPLDGKVALVTGASRGIGAAIARALDRDGATVVLSARHHDELASVAADLSHGPAVVAGDLAEASAPGTLVGDVLQQFGRIDILVNNAALGVRVPTETLDAVIIDRLLALNVRAPLLLIAAAIPSMRAQHSGAIVNISSVSGLVGTPRRSAYAATKGAIDAATRSLAIELGPDNIRVNSVAPGVVDTAMWARNKQVPGVVEQINAMTPLRRWSQPDDIADVVVFLASDAARFVTGETLSVDGGMGKTRDLYGGDV